VFSTAQRWLVKLRWGHWKARTQAAHQPKGWILKMASSLRCGQGTVVSICRRKCRKHFRTRAQWHRIIVNCKARTASQRLRPSVLGLVGLVHVPSCKGDLVLFDTTAEFRSQHYRVT
jgi:hypothetical protein